MYNNKKNLTLVVWTFCNNNTLHDLLDDVLMVEEVMYLASVMILDLVIDLLLL